MRTLPPGSDQPIYTGRMALRTKDAVSKYVRHRIAEMAKTQSEADIGEVLGIKASQVNMIKNGVRGVGQELEERFARSLAAGSVDQLRADAWAYLKEHPEDGAPETPDQITVSGRFPNLTVAAEFARRDGVPEAAIAAVQSQHTMEEDLRPSEWLYEMQFMGEMLKRKNAEPRSLVTKWRAREIRSLLPETREVREVTTETKEVRSLHESKGESEQ